MTRLIALMGMAFAIGVTVISTAYAGNGDVEAHHPWARPSIGNRPGVVYVRLYNKSGQPVSLTGIRTPIAKKAEIHTMSMEDGVMRMRRVEALEIPASGHVALEPSGYHIMLFGLKKPLKKGAKFTMTLTFDGADQIKVKVDVKKQGGMDHSGDMKKHHKQKRDPLSGLKLKDLTPSPD